MHSARRLLPALVGVLVLAGCQDPTAVQGSSTLLQAAPNGDGDSWKDTRGVEYRLGLVNTPELSECYGQIASAKRKQLTAPGFRAESYTVDTYGRRVSVVFLADGRIEGTLARPTVQTVLDHIRGFGPDGFGS